MKKRWIGRSIMYAALVFCIAIAGFYLGEPLVARADSSCCTYGDDCKKPGDDIEIERVCCEPATGHSFCSASQHNYCQTSLPCP